MKILEKLLDDTRNEVKEETQRKVNTRDDSHSLNQASSSHTVAFYCTIEWVSSGYYLNVGKVLSDSNEFILNSVKCVKRIYVSCSTVQ